MERQINYAANSIFYTYGENPAEYESKAKKEYTSIVILKAYIKKVTNIEGKAHF